MNAAEFLLGARALRAHGGRIALICGDESPTYADFAAQVARAAGALRAFGVQPGDRVLLLMRDTPECAAAWLGAVRAGAVAVGLNTKLSEEEYRHILADSGARLAIVEDVFAALRPDLSAELARGNRIAVAGGTVPLGAWSWRDALARVGTDAPASAARSSDPAFWLYSSGTTGRPKGIIHSHEDVLHSGIALRALGVSAGDCVFATSKFFFAYGLEHALLGLLALGATSLLCADWPEPQAAIDIAARHRPAAIFSVPSFFRRLLAQPGVQLENLCRVRHFVGAGERVPAQLIEQWRAAVGGEILSLYGTSETYCACLLTPPGTSDGRRTGRPLPRTEARLADSSGGEPAPGEPGVLWVRHPALALGYANRPDATREQFVDGWFCTSDVFVRDSDGFYVHQGRSDDFVKVSGQWVQPGELEDAALGAAGVTEAACVPVREADGFERLALFVTARGDPDAAVSAAALACEGRLPRHKRPKWIRAVGELPRTATGKVQRFKLREILEREFACKDRSLSPVGSITDRGGKSC